MEKNSSPVLTEQDLEEYRQGRVSDRIAEIWGLTYEELDAIIKSHSEKSKD